MTTVLANDLTENQDSRISLADLAALGAEELAAQVQRALPATATGQISVAAFQSSI
jgi:FXSXX-COOH protein